MDTYTENILKVDQAICSNIEKREALGNDGLLAQNVISYLRNFVEAIAIKIYSLEHSVDFNQEGTKQAVKYMKSSDEYTFLRKFHKRLEITASHLTVAPDASLRLLWRYYDDLFACKTYLKQKFDLDVLANLDDFPMDEDETLKEYYAKIALAVEHTERVVITENPTNRFYILKKKPFRVKGQKYYEITLTEADNKTSKFDRFIAFTKLNVPSYYAVHLRIVESKIDIINRRMPIRMIVGFRVSTRPCEFDNFFRLLGKEMRMTTGNAEYKALMGYLTQTGHNLTDLLDLDEDDFFKVRDKICADIRHTPIFDGLADCRKLYGRPGYNVLCYLLYRMNNVILKAQYDYRPNDILSDLYLKYKCIPFDNMPFANNLPEHNTILYDAFDCISLAGREHELLGRKIKTNTEINAQLYTPAKELSKFKNVEALIDTFNEKLYYKHRKNGSLKSENGYVFISGYENNTVAILKRLLALSRERVDGFRDSVNDWLKKNAYSIDDPNKKTVLQNLFETSKVAFIYGSAGTGKSTMIKHAANFFLNKTKIFLANTNAAVNNLKRNIGETETTYYSTINRFLKYEDNKSCDVLFIDECSTVSNEDMAKILSDTQFKLLVLVGDIYQIESIKFGNWFYIAKSMMPKPAVHELTYIHRSPIHGLRALWQSVRRLDGETSDIMGLYDFCSDLNETVFEKSESDEIVLCLQYDGLYGINNMNKFLQDDNNGKCVKIGIEQYKVGDPVIFKETTRFGKYLYNNLKGTITNIAEDDNGIKFYIEVDTVFNEFDAENAPFTREQPLHEGKSVVSFYVGRFVNADDDDKDDYHIIPFQVAYTVSIHKAQGLEYDSVKLIITDEVEELISHNIFYTAITRAKKKLKIYWTKHAEKYILDNMHVMYNKRDASILKEKFDF